MFFSSLILLFVVFVVGSRPFGHDLLRATLTLHFYTFYMYKGLIMDVWNFCSGHCNKRNLGSSKIMETALPVRRSVQLARGVRVHDVTEIVPKLFYTQCQHFLQGH